MTWIDVAYSIKDRFDYVEFATACRDHGIEQQFRPRDYVAIIKSVDTKIGEGLTYTEARSKLIEESNAGVTAQPGCCGGGEVK